EFDDRVASAKRVLLNAANQHAKGTARLGVRVQGLEGVELILAKHEGPQRRLNDTDLQQQADVEQSAAAEMISRLRSTADALRAGKATTESVIAAIRKEPN